MQAITTKYLAPTNTRGSRIKVSSWLGSKTYSYDHASAVPHNTAFNQWLEDTNKELKAKHEWHKGFEQVGDCGSLPDGTGYAFLIK